jgi:hypothetical protein
MFLNVSKEAPAIGSPGKLKKQYHVFCMLPCYQTPLMKYPP